MKLSCVIPAHNEEGCIRETLINLHSTLSEAGIEHEIRVINDNSTDQTGTIVKELIDSIPQIVLVNNDPPNGYGRAVRKGLNTYNGDAVCIYMADASDSPADVVRFFKVMESGCDCVFGSRWDEGGQVIDYPWPKRIVNRIANYFINFIFRNNYNDTTNAFKMYRNYVIEGLRPFLSHHFNMTVELPLKVIVRGYNYKILPNSWTNRKTGESKLKIKEMGSRYLFIVLYCLVEKWLSKGDYYRNDTKIQ
ncbi:MAG: glycosyltransferase family 2 protein [Desulfobacterales bacterium]|nr:glycosyltransferase family 2 protein [Desulfobacterales bacterium]